MKILKLIQGSPEWLAARQTSRNASEAAAMMGVGKYQTRTELLRQKATGSAEDIDPAKQKLFDRGHATEALARKLAEEILGEELYPVTATDDAGYLQASFDGVTMDNAIGFEHKLLNADLAAAVEAKDLPPAYYWQLEHQLLVGGLSKIIFVCSDGTRDNFHGMYYTAVPGRAAQLLAGWKQFDEDLAEYQHVEVLPAAVAAPTMALPALSIQVNGKISLIDNLAVFGVKLTEFIDRLNMSPTDDQGFADAEAAVKTLETAQKALEAAEASALAQTSSIDEMRRTVALYAGQARTTRLMLEKMVKTRKDTLRAEIVQAGKDALAIHITTLSNRIGATMPPVPADFTGVVKSKRTIASLRDAVDTELARAKIAANEIADRIQINLKTLATSAAGYEFLFKDISALFHMEAEAFMAIVSTRVRAHKDAEVEKAEAMRQKIRAEEVAKLAREEAAKLQAPIAPVKALDAPIPAKPPVAPFHARAATTRELIDAALHDMTPAELRVVLNTITEIRLNREVIPA